MLNRIAIAGRAPMFGAVVVDKDEVKAISHHFKLEKGKIAPGLVFCLKSVYKHPSNRDFLVMAGKNNTLILFNLEDNSLLKKTNELALKNLFKLRGASSAEIKNYEEAWDMVILDDKDNKNKEPTVH